jgi:RNA polymerase sigma-70 factor (ECF subfamily)
MNSTAIKTLAEDRETFAELYREFHPRVLGLCRYLLGSPNEAEDASSEVFARLPRAIKTYDSALPFSRWVSSVASHYCVDLLRRRRSEQRIFERPVREAPAAVSATSPLQELLLEEEKNTVRAAIVRLPERYCVPLVLRYYSELSYNEIAETLGISCGHVKILIFRAKKELRRALGHERVHPQQVITGYRAGCHTEFVTSGVSRPYDRMTDSTSAKACSAGSGF